MTKALQIALNQTHACELLPSMANRHGLISGATGTGKTVTLQSIAQHFSSIGVPVFATDIKGDLTGISQAGQISCKLATTLEERGITPPTSQACPTTLWDVFGEQGHPIRATVSNMGPMLLARMLDLNDTQTGVLTLIFKIADDHHLPLLDLKDLRSMVKFIGENAKKFTTEYGNISIASIGAIQRALLQIETQGGQYFFGEPMLNIDDILQTLNGQGIINILAADRLMHAPRIYAAFLLWMLSELFEKLPESGDLEKPKLVLFFDEAHLIFKDTPKVLIERVELVVRLIRSKGVGVYFATQNPLDIPQSILAQLSNRIQHALRAFSAQDLKAVKAIAQTMPMNDELNVQKAITELAIGEALISFLDAKGQPTPTQRAYIIPPGSQIGAIEENQRQKLLEESLVANIYENTIDRESAYEILQQRAGQTNEQKNPINQTSNSPQKQENNTNNMLKEVLFGKTGPRGAHYDGIVQTAAKSAARSFGNNVGKKFLRGVLGNLLGGKK